MFNLRNLWLVPSSTSHNSRKVKEPIHRMRNDIDIRLITLILVPAALILDIWHPLTKARGWFQGGLWHCHRPDSACFAREATGTLISTRFQFHIISQSKETAWKPCQALLGRSRLNGLWSRCSSVHDFLILVAIEKQHPNIWEQRSGWDLLVGQVRTVYGTSTR